MAGAADTFHFRPVAAIRYEPRATGRPGPYFGKRPDRGGRRDFAQPAAAPGSDHLGFAERALASGARRGAGVAGQFEFACVRVGCRAGRSSGQDAIEATAAQGARTGIDGRRLASRGRWTTPAHGSLMAVDVADKSAGDFSLVFALSGRFIATAWLWRSPSPFASCWIKGQCI